MIPIMDRIRRKSIEQDGHLLWMGATSPYGHGYIRTAGRKGRLAYVHRVAWTELVGPIPEGLEMDHLCRVPNCWAIEHLEPVPRGTNVQRGLRGFGLTGMCRKSLHDITDPANIYDRSDGGRRCKPCHLETMRRCKARKRTTH
jgi:hypothetical protein